MIKVSPETILRMESQHPGITEQIEDFELMALPTCPKCCSQDTAAVNVGIIGRTINLAAATTKFHLRANGKPDDFYCNACKRYFPLAGQLDPFPKRGRLYYDTGALRYEGKYREIGKDRHQPYGRGVMYYQDGTTWQEGVFADRGLREGKEYYPSGCLRFEGIYQIIYHTGLFPACGSYYRQDGTLSYTGEFMVEPDQEEHLQIVKPEDYGPPFLKPASHEGPSIQYGKLLYDTGEVRYEGYYEPFEHDCSSHWPSGQGTMYYKDGTIYKEGRFAPGGLSEGRIYYPSGQLKFEGVFNSKKGMTYYGPTYPIRGKFWREDGSLAYDGKFDVIRQGSVGFPKVVVPENFGVLD